MVQRQSPNTAAVAFLLVLANHLASCHAAEFGDAGRPFWIAHGSLMLLAWGVVFPLGALLAVFRKNVGEGGNVFTKYQSFYPPHLYFQCFGVLLNIIAVILAARGNYLEYETGNPFDEVLWDFTSPLYPWNHHVKWGVSVLIILTVQCIFGYVHHLMKARHGEKTKEDTNPTPWKRPIVPSWAHVIIGPLALLMAYMTLIQGFQIYVVIFHGTPTAPNAAIKFGYSVIGISAILFLIAYLWAKKILIMG